jgi:hypothetical protein
VDWAYQLAQVGSIHEYMYYTYTAFYEFANTKCRVYILRGIREASI